MKKTAVILLAHGSKKDNWNPVIIDFYKNLKNQDFLKDYSIGFFDVAFLQYKPFLYEVVQKLKDEDEIKDLLVIPLFITHSVHTLYDIPVLLNLNYYPDKYDDLIEENNYPIPENIKATLGPTISHGDLIDKIITERVMDKSKDPENESVILIAHGSDTFKGSWDEVMYKCSNRINEKGNFSSVEHFYVEAGQTLIQHTLPSITSIINQGKKAIIAGVYLVNNSKDIFNRFGNNKNEELVEYVNSGKVILTDNGIMPHEYMNKWVKDIIIKYAEKAEIKDMFV